jgi:hypothetical protein
MCNPYKSVKKNEVSKGFNSLSFVGFLIIFTTLFVFLGAQLSAMPSPITGQATIKYYPNGTSYLAYISDRGTASLTNVPNIDVSALSCGFGVFGLDGIAGCAITYTGAFVSFTQMSSDNTLLTMVVGILILLFAWAIATLWGGS